MMQSSTRTRACKWAIATLLSIITTNHSASSESSISPPPTSSSLPYVKGRVLLHGKVLDVSTQEDFAERVKDVYGCCLSSLDQQDETTTTSDGEANSPTCSTVDSCTSLSLLRPALIGSMPQFNTEQALAVMDAAKEAWKGGSGVWPTMSLKERIEAVEKFMEELYPQREEIVRVLMSEIGKNRKDAESEFDRTMSFMRQAIAVIRDPTNQEFNSQWETIGKTRAFVRRAAIGILMCLGPFNYPLNETYATLIPALLMGNIVIMKIPTVGGLVHLLTMEAFAKALPPGTIHFISGPGRETMPPLMKTGHVDALAFIGGSGAADALIKDHPEPHRLKVFLQLEAKNMAILLPDLFEPQNTAQLDRVLHEVTTGALSYNGQRCTALKIVFCPKEHSQTVAQLLAKKVEALRIGLPWQKFGEDSYAQITPLPNARRVQYMQRLIDNAQSLGAEVVNVNGGKIVGGVDSTLMVPAVLHPVTPDMDVYVEEQFGPVVPVAPYTSMDEVVQYAREGKYGQQCSIFTIEGGGEATMLVDRFASIFGKININSQCGRSPDTLPFSGRRSSALGVMSVTDALKEFSVPTVISYKDDGGLSEAVVASIEKDASFMQPL